MMCYKAGVTSLTEDQSPTRARGAKGPNEQEEEDWKVEWKKTPIERIR